MLYFHNMKISLNILISFLNDVIVDTFMMISNWKTLWLRWFFYILIQRVKG